MFQKIMSAIVALLLVFPLIVNAASITHFNADANTSVTIDDDGGNTDGFTFISGGGSHLSTRSGPILWDGTNFYNGPQNNDYIGGGIVLNDPSIIPGVSEDSSATFTAGPFQVNQSTYIVDGSHFVIHQWEVTNTTAVPVSAKILLAEDWDVGNDTANTAGYDGSRNLAYMQNPVNFSTAGSALLGGVFDNYYIWDCCEITYEGTAGNTAGFMNGVLVGDMSTGGGATINDKEVGVSANLGLIAPGGSACSAFVSVAINAPADLPTGLANIQAEIDAAAALFATLPNPCSLSLSPQAVDAISPLGLFFLVSLFSLVGGLFNRKKHLINN